MPQQTQPPVHSTDAQLVAAACQGDLASFGRLYERHYRLAIGIARSRLSDAHLAEDAAQEVKQFEEDHTVPNSFHYVGSGVKVGQADRIVGWYKLRGTTKVRAFYGDLSVRDVTEAELPLNLAN